MLEDIRIVVTMGVAIHCETESQARVLFELMGWEWLEDFDTFAPWHKDRCVFIDSLGEIIYDYATAVSSRNIISFNQLMKGDITPKSKLAEILGVEEDKPFRFKSHTYVVTGDDIRCTSGKSHKETKSNLMHMIANLSDIEILPRWSSKDVQAKAAIELLFPDARYIGRDWQGNLFCTTHVPLQTKPYENWMCDTGLVYWHMDNGLFENIQKNEFIALSELDEKGDTFYEWF